MQRGAWQYGARVLKRIVPAGILARASAFCHRLAHDTADYVPDGAGSGPVLPISRSDRAEKGDDGMRDYPNTRPQLSFEYLSGLVEWLAGSDFRAITYKDTRCVHGQESDEFGRWIARAKSRREKALLLHYDVDARPDVTMEILKRHIALRVPANVMVFRRKIFDWRLKRDGVLEYDDDYHLDHDLLKAFREIGGVVGYHCNAFDQAAGDVPKALEIFEQDIEYMKEAFGVEFISMHGGLVTPDGGCNARLPVENLLRKHGLSWVHNGHSVTFHNTWSDGGASNPNYRTVCSDPTDFIASTGVGQRCRLLMHPQYYNDFSNTHFDFPIVQDALWTRRVRRMVEDGEFEGKRYWQIRLEDTQSSIRKYAPLFEMQGGERPVFINGLSRSGTTLLCSIFDAHPEVAMGYESYPRYLHVPSDNGVLTPERYIYVYQTLVNHQEGTAFNLLEAESIRNLKRFAAVTSWTGMTTVETGELLRSYLSDKGIVADGTEALKVVAATIRHKVKAEGASCWGTKCQGNFAEYLSLWPGARLVYILRDGLDVLASQMKNGAFDPDPGKLGKQWRDHFRQFTRYRERNPQACTAIVRYEELVSSPEHVVRTLCGILDLPFHPQMIRQHEVETSLAKTPRGQLSAERVQQPIDTVSVGKWRRVLSDGDVAAFLAGCGGEDFYTSMGYAVRDSCAE